MDPWALALTLTHELSCQLSRFAKELLHHTKLCVLCMNVVSRRNVSAAKMADALAEHGALKPEEEFGVLPEGQALSIDVVVGTPPKLLELKRGRG